MLMATVNPLGIWLGAGGNPPRGRNDKSAARRGIGAHAATPYICVPVGAGRYWKWRAFSGFAGVLETAGDGRKVSYVWRAKPTPASV